MIRKLCALALGLLLTSAVLSQVTIYFPSGLRAVDPVVISPNGGNFPTEPQSVTLTEDIVGATINWNIGGSEFQCSSPCPVTLTQSALLTTYATAPGYQASIVQSAQFNITVSPTGAPIFTPGAPLTSALPMSVAVMSPSTGASSWCTTDGTPATTSSPPYVGAFTFGSGGVASQTTLRCVSQAPTLSVSAETIGVYTYAPQCPAPVLAPLGNTFVTSVSVTATDSCPSPTMYWAYDVQPTTASTVYSGPILVTQNHNIEIMATASLYAQSNTTVQDYIIVPPAPAATPTLLPMSGTQVTSPTTIPVLINDASPSATIYYCTAVSPATCTATTASASCSPAPCGPTLSTVDVYNVQAIATAPGFSTSSPANASYTIVSSGGGPLPCPQTSGTISVAGGAAGGAIVTRTSGASPLSVFFDVTGTTDTSIPAGYTAFQRLTYTWNFGDSGPSGNGVWLYGSNPGKNSKNTATGAVALHTYVTTRGGGDKTFVPTVTVTNGTSTVVCSVGTAASPAFTVYDSQGPSPHGFGGTLTTCAAATTTPVPGVGGCPAGAVVVGGTPASPLTVNTALNGTYMGAGRQVLFKCGDTFNGSGGTNAPLTSIGAYSGCEGTQAGRPIFNVGSASAVTVGASASDWRISDIYIAGSGAVLGNNGNAAINCGGNVCTQGTVYNVESNGPAAAFYDFNGTQIALVGFYGTPMGNINTFFNPSENQCANGSQNYSCGGTNSYRNVDYNFILGSYFDGQAGPSAPANIEVVRVSACRKCGFENTTFKNAGKGGAVLKIHNGNPNSQTNWIGQYTEMLMLTDDFFTGNAGEFMVELAPQNSQTDERLRNIVFERNLVSPVGAAAGSAVIMSGLNIVGRDNVCSNTSSPNGACFVVARRGIEWGSVYWGYALQSCPNSNWTHPKQCSGNATSLYGTPYLGYLAEPSFDELYNNSVYLTQSNTAIAATAKCNGATDPTCSGGGTPYYQGGGNTFKNTLMYSTGGGALYADGQNPTGANTLSNNTSNITLSPGFHNGSGAFGTIPDFIPSANYSGGTPVPVPFDALGNPWAPTWELGADSSAGVPITVNFFIQPTVTGAANHTYVAGKNGFRYDGTWLLDSVVPTKCAGGTDPSGLFTSTFNPVALTGLSSTTGNLSYSSAAAGCGTGSAYKFFAGDGAWSVQALHNMSGSQWIADIAALKAHPVPGGAGAQMYVAGWRWPSLESCSPTVTSCPGHVDPVTDATNGVGQYAGFQQILTVYAYLESPTTGIPGANFGVSVMHNSYGNSYTANLIKTRNWSTTGMIVPANIALGGCPSNCGVIAVTTGVGGSSVNYPIAPIYAGSGYYGIGFNAWIPPQCTNPSNLNPPPSPPLCTGGGFVAGTNILTDGLAALWNPGVNQAWINLWQALSLLSYCPPLGHPLYNVSCTSSTPSLQLTLDTDPLVKYIPDNDEYSEAMLSGYNPTDSGGVTVNPPNHLGGAANDTPSNTNVFARYKAWASASAGFFPHTLIGADVTYGFGAGSGTDTTANTAGYVNQNLVAGALSTIQGVALTTSDIYASDWIGVNGKTNTARANFGKQGFAGYTAIPQPYGLGSKTATSLAGTMSFVGQVQPGDYYSSLPSGVTCTTVLTCSGTVTALATSMNNTIMQTNMRLWWMDDENPNYVHSGDNGTWFWVNVIAPTINHTIGAGVPAFSNVVPTSLTSQASIVQATGTSMGTYITSLDVNCLGGTPPICKDGMFPEIWWAQPSTTPTGLTYPWAAYNGIQVNFWAQVPTATWPGMPAVGNTSSTGASYGAFDLAFEDLNGNQIVFDAGFFFGGQAPQTVCLKPVQDNQGGTAWELKFQIASAGCTNPYGAGASYFTWVAGAFSSTPFTGYQQYTINITKANFQQALNDIIAHGASVPANFSGNADTWGALHAHFNVECYHIEGPCSLGTSEHDASITFF